MPSLRSIYIAILAFLLIVPDSYSQTVKPVLDRNVTLIVVNERTDVVLNKLSSQAGFVFSYNPAVIDISKPVTGNFTNKPLREVLNRIFEGKVEYKVKGRYLILQKKKEQPVKPEAREFLLFSGYVRNAAGQPIPWVSVYDKESLGSTVSNDYGYYEIRFNVQQLPLKLFFSKQGFHDTVLVFDKPNPEFVNITLSEKIIAQPVPVNDDSLAQSAEATAASFFSSLENTFNVQNISDTLYRKWQVSFIPFAGTNGRLSGNVINEFSFNIFGGYSLGVTKAELSGFFNLNRGDVKLAQLAGFTNVSGGKVEGAQLAGFTNIVRGNVKAAQVAGFANVDFGTFKGAQVAGFMNVVMDTVKGFQAAGFCNFTKASMTGTQVAGFCNVAPDTITGTQIGFINYAGSITGSQLGFLNVSKSANGVPVGFLSYVHNGYHKVELAADEVFYTNISFRSGVSAFHNILTSGVNPSGDSLLLWHFGYGVGTTAKLGNKAGLDFDVTASQIVKGNDFDKINLLAKAYLGADIKLARQVSLAVGVTLNGQVTKTDYNGYPDIFTWYEPNIFYDHTWELDKTRLQMWLGGKIGLRFF